MNATFELDIDLLTAGGWPEQLPPRARLCAAPIMGSCGLTREDLVSFYMRTCLREELPPGTVASRIIIPHILGKRAVKISTGTDAWKHPANRGRGRQAVDWCEALTEITLQPNLELLTLLPVAHLLPESKLLAQAQRFCPHCYKADLLRGRHEKGGSQLYNRLLWSLDVVRACPSHGVRLADECPYCKENGEPTKLHGVHSPGVCPKCAYDLSNTPTREAELNEIDAARRVGDFLDNARWVKAAQVEGEGVKDFLRQMTLKVADGQYSKLAAMLGSTKNNMHGWIHGRVVPSFPAIVRMAQAFDCLISDVLLNNIVPRYRPQLAKESLRLHAPRCRSGKVNWTEVQTKIAQIEGQNLTLTEVAQIAGVDPKYIRLRFSDKAKEIVQASRNRKQREAAHRATDRLDAYSRAHHEVVARGESPTRRRVLAHLESSGIRIGWRDMHQAYWRARQVEGPEKAEI